MLKDEFPLDPFAVYCAHIRCIFTDVLRENRQKLKKGKIKLFKSNYSAGYLLWLQKLLVQHCIYYSIYAFINWRIANFYVIPYFYEEDQGYETRIENCFVR